MCVLIRLRAIHAIDSKDKLDCTLHCKDMEAILGLSILAKCPECGRGGSEGSKYFRYCGAKLEKVKSSKEDKRFSQPDKVLIIIFSVIVAFFIVFFIFLGVNNLLLSDKTDFSKPTSSTLSEDITENTIFTKSLSPYTIEDSPHISKGVILKFKKGVTFKMEKEIKLNYKVLHDRENGVHITGINYGFDLDNVWIRGSFTIKNTENYGGEFEATMKYGKKEKEGWEKTITKKAWISGKERRTFKSEYDWAFGESIKWEFKVTQQPTKIITETRTFQEEKIIHTQDRNKSLLEYIFTK